jgi:integrase
LKQTQMDYTGLMERTLQPTDSVDQGTITAFSPCPTLKSLRMLKTPPASHRLRDGEVVLYKRRNSALWQMRYQLYDRVWRRVSTNHHQLAWAIKAACEIYDRARFRESEGLPITTRRFEAIAKECLKQIAVDIERGIKPQTNSDYQRVIYKYLIPFFGKYMVNNIDAALVREYEQWRNGVMGKVPTSSTLATHSSAYNKVIDTAIQLGWLSDKVPVARLTRKGRKGTARPAFTKLEIAQLLSFLPKWAEGGKTAAAHGMRLLARDYIEILLATGMRCGKESMNMLWKHIEWYDDPKSYQRYIRIFVSGKTGGRWLIAKHIAADALGRLAVRQGLGADLDAAIAAKNDDKVFRLTDGLQPVSLQTTFKWLMKESGLAKDATTNQQRTLYSLRHTYATLSLMDGQMDMHTLAKQMGTSIAMLEQHYSKMTATMAAERLA